MYQPMDLDEPNTIQHIVAQTLVARFPQGGSVLDCNCQAGEFGEALASRNFQVTGISDDPQQVAQAKNRLSAAIKADCVDADWLTQVPQREFDAIYLAQILDDIASPTVLLNQVKQLLAPQGVIYIAVPNAAHGSVRLAQLQGNWTPSAKHLFTLENLSALLTSCDLTPIGLHATCKDVLCQADEPNLPPETVEWLRDQESAWDYQYVLLCAPAESVPTPPLPQPTRSYLPPRPYDKYARAQAARAHEELVRTKREQLLTALQASRAEALTARDTFIGLEAQIAHLQKSVRERDDTLHQVRTELIQTHARLAAALNDSSNAHRRLGMTAEGLALRTARKVTRTIKGA